MAIQIKCKYASLLYVPFLYFYILSSTISYFYRHYVCCTDNIREKIQITRYNIEKLRINNKKSKNSRDEFRVLPEHIKKRIKSYNTHEQLLNAVGGGYYQILPVHSILSPGMCM